MTPRDVRSKRIWRLTLHRALAPPTQIFHTSQLLLQPLERLQLPRSGGSELLPEAQKPGFGDQYGPGSRPDRSLSLGKEENPGRGWEMTCPRPQKSLGQSGTRSWVSTSRRAPVPATAPLCHPVEPARRAQITRNQAGQPWSCGQDKAGRAGPDGSRISPGSGAQPLRPV